MIHKDKDRRVRRTRAMLFEALLELMIEKGYEAITVQDLIDRANIGRSTFYFHFVDKEDLLVQSIEMARGFLREQMAQHRVAEGTTKFGFSLALLQHVQGHKPVYRATVGKQSGAVVLRHMQRMLTELAMEEMAGTLKKSNLPPELVVDFAVSTMMTLIAWWLDRNPHYTAHEVDRMFHQLILSGIGIGHTKESE